ncbi:hypothetical protein [uncultured Sulfuricurvum sp.]|nr:hypothetical protein [uncultured Sulfuricurvum sp.]
MPSKEYELPLMPLEYIVIWVVFNGLNLNKQMMLFLLNKTLPECFPMTL